MTVLGALTADAANEVWVVSGRARRELGAWFESLVSAGAPRRRGGCWGVARHHTNRFRTCAPAGPAAPTNPTRAPCNPPRPLTRPRPQPNLGLAAEHGFYTRAPGASEWAVQQPHADSSWQAMSLPILKQYQVGPRGGAEG